MLLRWNAFQGAVEGVSLAHVGAELRDANDVTMEMVASIARHSDTLWTGSGFVR